MSVGILELILLYDNYIHNIDVILLLDVIMLRNKWFPR